MKKLCFYFFAPIALSFLFACGSDPSDCSFQGKWKVKTADIQSEQLDKTTLELSKELAAKAQYTFTADSVTIETGGPAGNFTGTYTVDAATGSLNWNASNPTNPSPYPESMKIQSCSGNEVTLTKRVPADTTKPALTNTTLVITKI